MSTPYQPAMIGETIRYQETSDDIYTPRWVFDALGLTFDLDVCAPPEGPPHTPASSYYSVIDDGLAQPWHGLVWMNPPYSKPTPWVERFLRHNNGVALLPFAKARWWDHLWSTDLWMLALKQEQDFVKRDGTKHRIFMPVFLAAAGDQSKQALSSSGLGRVRQ